MIPKEIYSVLGDIWPMIAIFVIVVSFVRVFSLLSSGKRIVVYKELIMLIFAVYLLLLFELVSTSDFQSIGNNYQPLKEILRHKIYSPLFYRNVVGNVVMFIPFGIFVSYYIYKSSFLKLFILTLITSITIESVQLKIGRSFDIDDIILNVLGGIIGFILYKILVKIKRRLPKFIRSELFLNIVAIIITIILLMVFINYTGIWRFF